jgi:hypothetical protein
MSNSIDHTLQEKRHTPFHERRIERAKAQVYDAPVTAYLSDVFITSSAAVGIVFGHKKQDDSGRFGDGHRIRTSSIQSVEKQGRFWVLETINSTYVITSFKREVGRASFHAFLSIVDGNYHHAPVRIH